VGVVTPAAGHMEPAVHLVHVPEPALLE